MGEYKIEDIYNMGCPHIDKSDTDKVFSGFPDYIFWEAVKPGVRECVCTACGQKFTRGANVTLRCETAEDRAMAYVKHGETCVCPKCHKTVNAVNRKIQLNKATPQISLSSHHCFFIANNPNDVWLCCAVFVVTYFPSGRKKYDIDYQEFYHYTPGAAQHYKKTYGYWGWSNKYYDYRFRKPFQQNYGMAHYEFDYDIVCVGKYNLQDTFLKYSGFEAYHNMHRMGASQPAYFGWYSIHPQIEMLAKFGIHNVIDCLMYYDEENKRIIDWNAKRPWDMFRLTKPLYEYWKDKCDGGLGVLKVFHRLKGKKPKDFDTAQFYLHVNYSGLKETYSVLKNLRNFGKTPEEAKKYFEYISHHSGGACHNCIGITVREAYQMWKDYISMSNQNKKTFSPFPSNLKAAHDALITAKRLKEKKNGEKAAKKQIEKNAVDIAAKYENVQKILKRIHDKYSYDNGKYCFVMPEKIQDILYDGYYLNQCTVRSDAGGKNWRYFDRINRNESYIGFVRLSGKTDTPWFTVEFEPGGTVRQKRSFDDSQPAGTTPSVIKFLCEWQEQLSGKLNKNDMAKAKAAKIQRIAELEDLRKTKKIINYGPMQGKLLVEALELDLLEIKEA